MTLRQKYVALADYNFVKEMVVSSVYGTMQLEEQGLSMEQVRALYDQEKESKRESTLVEELVEA